MGRGGEEEWQSEGGRASSGRAQGAFPASQAEAGGPGASGLRPGDGADMRGLARARPGAWRPDARWRGRGRRSGSPSSSSGRGRLPLAGEPAASPTAPASHMLRAEPFRQAGPSPPRGGAGAGRRGARPEKRSRRQSSRPQRSASRASLGAAPRPTPARPAALCASAPRFPLAHLAWGFPGLRIRECEQRQSASRSVDVGRGLVFVTHSRGTHSHQQARSSYG